MTAAAEPPAVVDLAREPDFRLGAMLVSPSACRIRADGDEHRIEPRVMQVLVVLAREAGRTVTRDELIDTCWDGRIVSDDAVTRVIAQVRALGRSHDPAPFVLETVPKVGFRLIASDAPPPAEAMPAAAPQSTTRPTPPSRRWPWALAALGLLAVVAAAVLGWSLLKPPAAAAQSGRVEVMQFEARSPDPGVRQAAIDIPQDLVRILASGGVQTAREPRRRDDASSDAELRITGSVGLDAGKYAITGQVIDRKSGLVLLDERDVRTSEEQARSPGEFPAELAAVVSCTLKDRALAKAPLSIEAMGLYLKACGAVFFDGDDGERMLAVTRRLVKAAPRFAGAHAMHAIGAALLANAVKTPAEAQALHAEAKAAATTAIRLDPRAAKAYSALAINEGIWREQMQHNWFAEERYLLQALKYDPELAPARNEYAGLLRSTGRTTEALEFLKASAAAEDPRFGGDPRVAMMMAATGDLPGADRILSQMEAHDRVSQAGMRWTIAFWWEDPRTALPKTKALAAEAPTGAPCFEAFLAELPARQARHQKGLPPSCATVERNWRARMLAREGDVDGAFAELSGGRIPGGPLLFYYPETRVMRQDPRFWAVAKRIGLVDYWVKSGHWPDFCAEPGADCRAAAAAVSTSASAPARTVAR
ncbi:MAG: winged helix-turn-helix domain-containing protein [Phenylobacterium sp.]